MNESSLRIRGLAVGLAALAGFVDATGFLRLGGRFVSFMSGNSTRLAVDSVHRDATAWIAAAIIATFVGGVIIGSLVGVVAGRRRGPVVLALVGGLLAAAAALADAGLPPASIAFMVLAMGAENAVFQRDGQVAIGLTYMTGALVKLGQHVAAALLGGPRFAWVPNLLLWLGLVGGAVLGSGAYPRFGLDGLWLAAVAAAGFAALATRV